MESLVRRQFADSYLVNERDPPIPYSYSYFRSSTGIDIGAMFVHPMCINYIVDGYIISSTVRFFEDNTAAQMSVSSDEDKVTPEFDASK